MTAFLEEKLDKEVVAGGQKGLAFLLSNTVLKDKYKCVDPSRQNFEFTNELGEVERDVKAKKLTNALIKSDICSKSGEIGMELWKKEDGSTDSLRYEAHSKNVLEMIISFIVLKRSLGCMDINTMINGKPNIVSKD